MSKFHTNFVPWNSHDWGRSRRFVSPQYDEMIQYLSEETLESESVVLGISEINPHSEKPDDTHEREEEAYFFVSGSGKCQIADEEIRVESGSSVYIPSNTSHSIMNDSDTPLTYYFALGKI